MTRIGHGYDVHRFERVRPLILGGVRVPYEYGLSGHSDADVLVHAVCDSLLGAAALGDIGKLFPDACDEYSGIDSRILLRKTVCLLKNNGYTVGNVDSTVIAQSPKLSPFTDEMRRNIASDCGIDVKMVSVKATTEEGLGFSGRREGIAAHAVCTVESI